MKRNPMTAEQANAVFDILVADCGAGEANRYSFVYNITRGREEYRCCWALGFGGKFYPETMTVGYCRDNQTAERDEIEATVNVLLAGLADEWAQNEA